MFRGGKKIGSSQSQVGQRVAWGLCAMLGPKLLELVFSGYSTCLGKKLNIENRVGLHILCHVWTKISGRNSYYNLVFFHWTKNIANPIHAVPCFFNFFSWLMISSYSNRIMARKTAFCFTPFAVWCLGLWRKKIYFFHFLCLF